MRKHAGLFCILTLIAAALACSITPTAAPITPDPNQLATAVAATLTAMVPPAATDTIPGSTPEDTPAPTGTATQPPPICLPTHPGAQNLPLPAGVAIGLDENIALYNLQGTLLANRPVTGMTFMDSEHAHLAGSLGAGANALPIMYFSLQDGGKLKQNINNVVIDLIPAQELTYVIGAEASPFFTYTAIDWDDQWTNDVYAGTSAGLTPRFTWTPPEEGHIGNAIRPLAVHTTGGVADGIWYTYTMQGIGNINYPPYNGLFYFNLSSGTTMEFLPPDNAIGGLSPDQTLVAYGPGQGGAPGVIFNSVTIRNLVTCQETVIPFNAASNLGGGWMVFSPDNQLVAWTEANGPSNMGADFRLRVARTDGASLFDSPLANLGGFLGGEAPNSLTTVGWAANHILTMQAYLNIINQYVVIIWAPDPALPLDPVLGANQSVPLADGEFIGLLYP